MSKKELFWVAMLLIGSVVIGTLWMDYHNSLHPARQPGLTDADIAGFKEYPPLKPGEKPDQPGPGDQPRKHVPLPAFPAGTPAIRILAAASTGDVIKAFAKQFEAKTGVPVIVSTGGSNQLAQQILNGAPADLFLAADEQWADAVAEKGLVDRRVDLFSNELVLIVPRANPAGIQTPQDLLKPQMQHLALAGESVPAGKYAGQALAKLGLLQALMDSHRVVRGSDVRVACNYVLTGEADAGVVYQTDARAEAHKRLPPGQAPPILVIYPFPPESHDAIQYPLVLLKRDGASPAAAACFNGLRGAYAEFADWELDCLDAGFGRKSTPAAAPVTPAAPTTLGAP